MEKITWSAFEYEEKEHNTDWFWALGVIIIAGAAASIIFANYFFAALLVIGGVLMGVFSIKKPEMVSYELGDGGLKIKTRLYPYKEMRGFWVQKNEKATLFIKTSRLIMPMISVPIEATHAEDIKEKLLSSDVKEEEMKEHLSEKIMESLGF